MMSQKIIFLEGDNVFTSSKKSKIFGKIAPLKSNKYIISLTKSVLMVVGDMYFGSSELQEFLNIYPDVII